MRFNHDISKIFSTNNVGCSVEKLNWLKVTTSSGELNSPKSLMLDCLMWQTTFSLILFPTTVDQQLETHLVQVNRYFGFKVVPTVGISYNVNVLYSIDFTKYVSSLDNIWLLLPWDNRWNSDNVNVHKCRTKIKMRLENGQITRAGYGCPLEIFL